MAHLTGTFRLGRDAEKVESENGSFLSLSLAYDTFQGGQTQTQWVRATMSGGQRADAVADKLTKGTTIFATLRNPHIESYKSREGEERHALSGRIMDFEFVGGGAKPAAEAPEST